MNNTLQTSNFCLHGSKFQYFAKMQPSLQNSFRYFLSD
jgi:hypothetical protein